MSVRNKFLIILGVIFTISLTYYLLSTPSNKDLILIGTVDSNQVIVSPQIEGRLAKLLVDEGTQVKQGDLIAVLDPSELEAEERAAAATIDSMRSKVAETQSTLQATQGSTIEQRRERAGPVAIDPRSITASGSDSRAHAERQPTHDRAGQRGSGIRSGSRAGRDQPDCTEGAGAIVEQSG